jgi:pimeloyl-ACP methyl ester carboxylesterase
MNWPSFQMALSRWNALADDQGFIVVYPAGTGGGPKVWTLRGLQPARRRAPDIVFISELIDSLEATYNIDPARIYANGLSNGGGMTYALSCTLADRIAAFGPVASAITEPIDWCSSERPAPVIAFHGTAGRCTHDADVLLYTVKRRSPVVRRNAGARVAARPVQPQRRRDEGDVGVLRTAPAEEQAAASSQRFGTNACFSRSSPNPDPGWPSVA